MILSRTSWFSVVNMTNVWVILGFIWFNSNSRLFMTVVDAKTKTVHNEIREGRKENVDRYDEVYTIVRNTFLLALAPVFLQFFYYIYTDPDLPRVRKALWQKICQYTRQRLLSNLSQNNPNNQIIDDEDDEKFPLDDSSSDDDDDNYSYSSSDKSSTVTNSYKGQNATHAKYNEIRRRKGGSRYKMKSKDDSDESYVPILSPLPINNAP